MRPPVLFASAYRKYAHARKERRRIYGPSVSRNFRSARARAQLSQVCGRMRAHTREILSLQLAKQRGSVRAMRATRGESGVRPLSSISNLPSNDIRSTQTRRSQPEAPRRGRDGGEKKTVREQSRLVASNEMLRARAERDGGRGEGEGENANGAGRRHVSRMYMIPDTAASPPTRGCDREDESHPSRGTAERGENSHGSHELRCCRHATPFRRFAPDPGTESR